MTHSRPAARVVHSPYDPYTGVPARAPRRARRAPARLRAPTIRGAAFGLALWALLAPHAGAQRPAAALSGVVKDETGAVIPNVEVSAIKVRAAVRTDSLGRFLLANLPPGPLEFTFRRLAFSPFLMTIDVSAGDTTDVEVTLSTAGVKLPTVTVQGTTEHHRQLDGFEERRRQGLGHYVTRTEIETRDPLLLSEMMRTIPGTFLVPTGLFGMSVLRFSRRVDCLPTYFVDGMLMRNYNIDDMPVRNVEGIEVYSGTSGLPGQFVNRMNSPACGTVVIWTRIPGT